MEIFGKGTFILPNATKYVNKLDKRTQCGKLNIYKLYGKGVQDN